MVKMDFTSRDIHSTLARKFKNEGHNIYVVMPMERREGKPTTLKEDVNVKMLYVKTFNVQQSSIIEKGIGQVSIEFLYNRAIKKYYGDVKFDLIIYTTPPITLMGVVKEVKKRCPNATAYLLLKDIFPQNAVDMGMMKKTGVKSLLYKYFRKQEENLYRVSDYIGCMSPANVKYVLKHNGWIAPSIVEVAPNAVELEKDTMDSEDKKEILLKYGIPTDKPIFIYGGNLGIPQGIPFLIECLEANKTRKDCHFVIVGNGTYYQILKDWYKANPSKCVTIMKGLPKADYDKLVRACQIGLIFLDYRFTIPNYPSRLLSYLEYKMPVICATDPNCDMGTIANKNGFGMWVPSNNAEAFTVAINKILASDIKSMGKKGYEFLKANYLVDNTYNQIIKHIK